MSKSLISLLSNKRVSIAMRASSVSLLIGICLNALVVQGALGSEASVESAGESSIEQAEQVAESQPGEWVDESFDYLTDSANTMAVWLDSFFGTVEDDADTAHSRLRLRLEYDWDEDDGSNFKPRIRGKVYLPSLDDRLSLVFQSDEDDEGEETFPDTDNIDDSAGLAYDILESVRSKLSLTATFNSSLEFRSALRYRYTYQLSENLRARWTERLYYRQEEGVGIFSRLDLDRRLSDRFLLRWTNNVDYGEETDGAEWRTRFNLGHRLSSKRAFNYYAAVKGQTDPESYISDYAVGVRYRQSFFKPWIFFEVEPSHKWSKDTFSQSRESIWGVTLRVELLEELKD